MIPLTAIFCTSITTVARRAMYHRRARTMGKFVALGIVGGLFVMVSCVGVAWLMARLGFVKVEGITRPPDSVSEEQK